jgi:hypothetical protein
MRTILALLLALLLPLLAWAGEDARPAPAWEKVFPKDRILDIHLTLSAADWERLPVRPFGYVEAGFRCGSVSLPKVGLRVKGNSSATIRNERKSLKIDFDRFDGKARFHGLSKLNLHNGFNDPTVMREFLAYRLFHDAGAPASRVGYARIFVTLPGRFKDKLLGLYVNVEQVNGTFLRDRFADASGNLWKGESGSDFTYPGDDPEALGGYELKRNEDRGDYARLVAFLRALGRTPDASFASEIEKHLDVEAFLGYVAANTLLANLDSPAGTGHNYYIYHDPASDRFTVIPWDLNLAFGTFRSQGARDMERLCVGEPYGGDKVLFRRVLSVGRFRKRYREKLEKLVEGPFSPKAVAAEVDRIDRLIRKAVEEDPLMQFSNEDYRKALEEDLPRGDVRGRRGGILGLKSFVRNRVASVKAQLAGREKGVKPVGREFRGPRPSAGAVSPSCVALGDAFLFLSSKGVLHRLAAGRSKPEAGGALPGVKGGTDGRFAEDFLKRFDRNGDGRVSDEEFTGPREVFKRADADHDRSLDRREIPALDRSRERKRPVVLCAGTDGVAVVGQNTLYVFAPDTLAYAGHNRFGRPVGTHFERKGETPGPRPFPVAVTRGKAVWILAEDKVLRIGLKGLRVKAEASLPLKADPAGDRGGERLKTLDRDGNGVVDFPEWDGRPEEFKRADRNRDRVLDAKEVLDLPAQRSENPPPEGRKLYLSDDALIVVVGSRVWKLGAKKLEVMGSLEMK